MITPKVGQKWTLNMFMPSGVPYCIVKSSIGDRIELLWYHGNGTISGTIYRRANFETMTLLEDVKKKPTIKAWGFNAKATKPKRTRKTPLTAH